MAETPNLDLLLLEVGAPNREVVVNNGLAVLDSTVAGVLALDVAGAGDYTLTDTIQGEAKYGVLRLSGALTGARNLIVPDRGRQYVLENATTGGQTLTVKTAAGAGVAVAEGTWALLICDGTAVVAAGIGGGGALPAASETVAGITRYGTTQEAVDGLLTTVATHPAGVKAAVDAGIAASGVATLTGVWSWTTSTSGSVNSGKIGVDSATFESVTEVRQSYMTDTNVDTTVGLRNLTAGDVLYLQDKNDSTRRLRVRLTAPGTDQGDWISFPVTPIAVGTAPFANNQQVLVAFGIGAAPVTPGTPLSVARYAADGATLEATPLTIDLSGNMGLRTATPEVGLHVVGESTNSASVQMDGYQEGSGGLTIIQRRARGSSVAPGRLLLHDIIGGPSRAEAWVRNASDTADEWVQMGQLRFAIDSVDAQGRTGGRLNIFLSSGASASVGGVLTLSQAGNLGLTATLAGDNLAGTGATRTLVLGPGVFPSTSPTDTVQCTAIDRAPGKRSLAIRTEDGTSHLLGDLSGIGTLLSATLGSGASYQTLSVNGSLLTVGASSVQERAQALLSSTWVVSTDATRTARLTLSAYDATAAREGLRVEADGANPRIGFLGAAAVVRQTVPAAATDAATTQALANSLRSALINLGLCA